MAGKSDWTNSV